MSKGVSAIVGGGSTLLKIVRLVDHVCLDVADVRVPVLASRLFGL
jgi:hypothetical protein